MVTYTQVCSTLEAHNEHYSPFALQDDILFLVTQRGGRLLGPFLSKDDPSLLWVTPALADADSFQTFINANDWNLGGERCWIAPEIQYNVRNRQDFFGSLSVPKDMDPGHYSMHIKNHEVHFEQEIALEPYLVPSDMKRLHLAKTIRLAANPVPDFLMEGIQYAGYEQSATLTDLNPNATLSEIWNLVQLNAGGTLIIPCIGQVASSDYFGSVPDEARYANGNHLRIPITGRQQFKVGYKATCMTGRMGYRHTLADGREYLLVRCFFNNPSNTYAEEPPLQEGNTGHSVHVYNDGGEFGGQNSFGEMECSGHTVGGETGRITSTDSFFLWAYIGTSIDIQRVTNVLLGVK